MPPTGRCLLQPRATHYLFASMRTAFPTRTLYSFPSPTATTTPGPSIAAAATADDDDGSTATVLHIINTSPSANAMVAALRSSGLLVTNDLIERVLLRVRFAHTDPLRALAFFSHAAARRGFFHTSFSLDTMLYVLGRGRRFDLLWQVLRETRRKDPSLVTTRTLQVVLGRVAKICSVRQTVQSFWGFKKLLKDFDTSCFNALLRALCQEKSMVDAKNVYHSLKRDFRPDLCTFNILLSGWKSPAEAEGFWKEMEELGVKPDLVSYNSLVDAYCKSREVGKALEIVEKMRNVDVCPDVITYTSIIGGWGLIGQPDKAKDLLREMREWGCYPDVAAYNAAVRNYCIAKRLRDAFALMDEMEAKGLCPNPTSYNLFLRCFYWSNEVGSAWSLYRKMRDRGCLPNTQSCMFLVRLCRRQEKVELALELWNDMVENGFGSFTLVSDVLIDLLCDMGKLGEAENCFLQMVEKGQKPSSVSFRRIKVLMELAKQHESLKNLTQKMAIFGRSN